MFLESLNYLLAIAHTQDIKSKRTVASYCERPMQKNIDDSELDIRFLLHSLKDVINAKVKMAEHIKSFSQIINSEMEQIPNHISISLSLDTLEILNDLDITPVVNPSLDGSIIFEFFVKEQYHLIEIHNEGDIILLERNDTSSQIKAYSFIEIKERLEFISNGELQVL